MHTGECGNVLTFNNLIRLCAQRCQGSTAVIVVIARCSEIVDAL